MSRATVRSLGGSAAQRGLDELLSVMPDLVGQTMNQYSNLLRRGSRLLDSALPTRSLFGTEDCCDIPEQDCPPRCVCEIDWEASPGETVQASIKVTNRGSTTRNFSFIPTRLEGASPSPGVPTVTPSSKTLAPGEVVSVTVSIQIAGVYQPGQTYTGEVLIRGSWEQCVKLRLRVCTSSNCQCEVEQGDPPVRIRAHRWYDHFRCEEPCFDKLNDSGLPTLDHDHP